MEEKIIEKAGELFLNLGFKSVTMDDIANSLGISKKTLYNYFSNKASLVDAAVKVKNNEIEKKIFDIKEKKFNAIEEEFVVKAVMNEMFKDTKESPMYQLKKYYPEAYINLTDKQACVFNDCNSDNLRKGIEQGLYRTDININEIVSFYSILVFGNHEGSLSTNNTNMKDILKMEYKVIEYHIRAIATEKGVIELEKQLNIISKN